MLCSSGPFYMGKTLPRIVSNMSEATDIPDIHAHTEIHRDEHGQIHVQHYGEGHVVEGSVTVVELPPGTRVLIRHLK